MAFKHFIAYKNEKKILLMNKNKNTNRKEINSDIYSIPCNDCLLSERLKEQEPHGQNNTL